VGIFQGDIIIKTMIDLGIDEMRKNEWLLDHAFESLKSVPYISDKYGQKAIDAAKEWFRNNEINVYMRPRNDKDALPCVTITPGPHPELPEMKSMADLSSVKKILMPQEIGKPIPFVVKPFTPTGYDPSTGEVGIDPNTAGFDIVVPGMILVNPANGIGFIIQGTSAGAIIIEDSLDFNATELAVIPKFAYYEARVEHMFCADSYNISCQTHGDVQNTLWLHTIVLYAILRYRESLLEGSGFAQSSVNSGEIMQDPQYEGPGGETSYLRMIQLTGQIENSWIKAPRRFIEAAVIKDRDCQEISSGIKILSNYDTPPTIDAANEVWTTVDEDDEDDID
jgi:hypothetical protein